MSEGRPKWWQWSYVERLDVGQGHHLFVRIVRRRHPGYWVAVALGYLRKVVWRG